MVMMHVEAARAQPVAAKVGDAGAAMFVQHRDGAYRVAWRLLGDRQAALRVMAASFIRTIRGTDGDESSASFRMRLHRIVVNLIRKQPRPQRDQPGGRSKKTPVQRMELALRALPGDQREAFALAVDGELAYEEIAAVQGVSTETAMIRVYHARQGLHDLLTKPKKRH